jgi:hypothetical protein
MPGILRSLDGHSSERLIGMSFGAAQSGANEGCCTTDKNAPIALRKCGRPYFRVGYSGDGGPTRRRCPADLPGYPEDDVVAAAVPFTLRFVHGQGWRRSKAKQVKRQFIRAQL